MDAIKPVMCIKFACGLTEQWEISDIFSETLIQYCVMLPYVFLEVAWGNPAGNWYDRVGRFYLSMI